MSQGEAGFNREGFKQESREEISQGFEEYWKQKHASIEEKFYKSLSVDELREELTREQELFNERRKAWDDFCKETPVKEQVGHSYIGDNLVNVETIKMIKSILGEK